MKRIVKVGSRRLAAAALAVALLVCLSGCGGSGRGAQSDNYVPAGNYSGGAEAVEQFYNVTIEANCRENLAMNKYDVDILLDGDMLATLGHGRSDTYNLELSAGSHTLEFRINGTTAFGNAIYDPSDSDTFCRKTIHVSEDETFSYRAKLVKGNGIEVDQLS